MKTKALVAVLAIGFTLSVVFYAYIAYTEYKTNRIASEYYDNQEYEALYDFYFDPQTAIEGRRFIGNEDAAITVAAVIDPLAQHTAQFLEETVTHVTDTYVASGQAKLYFKYYMTEEEYDGKKGRFIYASAGHCYNGTDSLAFHKELVATAEQEVQALLAKHGVGTCSEEALYEDMVEAGLFRIVSPSLHIGINGTQNTVLINPDIEQLDREMKFKLIGIGI